MGQRKGLTANKINFEANDAQSFQEFMLPLVGESQIYPASGIHFEADISVVGYKHINFFRVRSPSIHVNQGGASCDFVLNIPLGRGFEVMEHGSRIACSKNIFLRTPGTEFNFESKSECSVLGVCLSSARLNGYRVDLAGGNSNLRPLENQVIPYAAAAGEGLTKDVSNLLAISGSSSPNPIAIAELEDSLTSTVVALIDTEEERSCSSNERRRIFALSKDYLASCLTAPASRAELASITDTSIRTISRIFGEELGLGPIEYLKIMRMEAAYLHLLGGTREQDSVTDIATHYGLNHLGRFSVEYKERFGESPLQTLIR